MIIWKTAGAFRAFAVCIIITSASLLPADAAEKEPKIPKYIMSLFDDKTDAHVGREYLSKAELYELLSKYPVFCDGATSSAECYQISFESETTGTMHGQAHMNQGVMVSLYQDGPFHLSDDGLCTKDENTDFSLEIFGKDNEEISGVLSSLSQHIFAYDNYVTLDCIKFSHSNNKNAKQGEVALDQYEHVQLINGHWKVDKKPTPTQFYKAWNMAPGHFAATKLAPSDVNQHNQFGAQLAISGRYAIVGALSRNDEQGVVYVYDVKTGKQIAELTEQGSDVKQLFGGPVAIYQDTAVVGAKGVQENPAAVYLFDLATGKQTESFTVKDDTKTKRAKPIYPTVGISGSTAIVGLPGYLDPDGLALQLGRTVYLLDTTTGEQRAELTPDDNNIDKNWFGASVAISGTTAIVGAPAENKGVGAAYLFDTKTGAQIAKLVAGDPTEKQAFFGGSVAISGHTAIIGASGQDDYKGAAYLFDTTTGKQIAKLTAGTEAGPRFFGVSVAISGNTALVGSTGIPIDDNKDMRGAAYVFDITTGSLISWITAGNSVNGAQFGAAVAISGDSFFIAARANPKNKDEAGAAYLFHRK